MVEDKIEDKRGFAGLESLVSEVGKVEPSPAAEPIREPRLNFPAPAPAPAPSKNTAGNGGTVNTENLNPNRGRNLLIGWGVVGLLIVALAITSRNSKPKQVITAWVATPTVTTKPTQVARPMYYERTPQKGSSMVLDKDQIRYCLSQEIRLSTWETRVNTHSHMAVDAFNAAVDDYNARCSSFRYQRGSLESIRAEVEANRYNLQLQGMEMQAQAERERPAAQSENVLKPPARETVEEGERENSDKPEMVLGYSIRDDPKFIIEDDVTTPPPAVNEKQKLSTSATHAQRTGITPVVETRKILADGLEYILIPAGAFEMGCVPEDSECDNDEYPRHPVSISKMFWLGKTEVTVLAYRHFAQATGREMPPAPSFEQGENHPVVNVSWDDAVAYCAWIGGRLPSEAEWEYAARGGYNGKYLWGKTLSHYNANYGGSEGRDRWTNTSPVGSFEPNGFGLFDMAGNVWEWCLDWYGASTYASSPSFDPPGPSSGSSRVLRGGSWFNSPKGLRTSLRSKGGQPARVVSLGFRCARDVPG